MSEDVFVAIEINFISIRLTVRGDSIDPYEVARLLGVSCEAHGFKGESSRRNRVFDTNFFSWSVDGCGEGGYEHEMREAVGAFSAVVLPVAPRIRELSRTAEVVVNLALGCHGKAAHCDGWWLLDQGFTLNAATLGSLAELGLRVHITEYVSIPDGEQEE